MVFYAVLCLKNILGFLLLEHTSGVSPVIFSIYMISRFGFTDLLCSPFFEFSTIIHLQGTELLLLVRAELENLR